VDEPSLAPVEEPPQGFSCPGPLYLPGLLSIAAAHVGAMAAALWQARGVGVSGSLVGTVAGALAGFWLVFLLVSRWAGCRGAVNLVGFVAVVLFWLGLAVGAVWWLVQVV
jgi:hypothetical protein